MSLIVKYYVNVKGDSHKSNWWGISTDICIQKGSITLIWCWGFVSYLLAINPPVTINAFSSFIGIAHEKISPLSSGGGKSWMTWVTVTLALSITSTASLMNQQKSLLRLWKSNVLQLKFKVIESCHGQVVKGAWLRTKIVGSIPSHASNFSSQTNCARLLGPSFKSSMKALALYISVKYFEHFLRLLFHKFTNVSGMRDYNGSMVLHLRDCMSFDLSGIVYIYLWIPVLGWLLVLHKCKSKNKIMK